MRRLKYNYTILEPIMGFGWFRENSTDHGHGYSRTMTEINIIILCVRIVFIYK